MSWQDGNYGCRKQQHRHKQPIAKGMQDTAKTQNTATTLPSNLVRTNHKIRRHPETILMLEWCSSCMHAWNHTHIYNSIISGVTDAGLCICIPTTLGQRGRQLTK